MKKNIIITSAFLASMLCAVDADASVLFFSEAGAGEKDGSSWENSASADMLAATIKDLQPGDELYLQGGFYAPGLLSVPQGVTIKGGFGDDRIGTDCAIEYPSVYETILSADTDGDGNGDNSGVAFIVMDFAGDAADYQKTVLAGLTIRDAHTTSTTYKGSALFASNVNAEFDHLKFIENRTEKGGGMVVLNGSRVYLHDCIWRDNKGTNAGVALHIRQKGGGTTAGNPGSEIIVDRCEFSDNTVAQPTNNNVAKYGGAIALSDNGGTMYMANSTVTGTHISWAGAGARIGGGTTFYSLHNTWFDCTCNQAARYSGAVLSVGNGAKFYSYADIVVNKEEGRDDDGTNSFAAIFLQSASTGFTSGGHNLWQTVTNNTASQPAESDNIAKTNTVASVFGENEYAQVDYSRVIAPLEAYRTVSLDDSRAIAEAWNLPAELDLTLDQTGATRPETTVPGAYDEENYKQTGIAAAMADGDFSLRAMGAGRYAVCGTEGAAAVYDLGGRRLVAVYVAEGDILDLSALASGIYIVSVNGMSVKLAI